MTTIEQALDDLSKAKMYVYSNAGWTGYYLNRAMDALRELKK